MNIQVFLTATIYLPEFDVLTYKIELCEVKIGTHYRVILVLLVKHLAGQQVINPLLPNIGHSVDKFR